jgi:hypothetical protein
MAIIQCPQCKWGMSDKARICRNCGYFRTVHQASGATAPQSSTARDEGGAGPATRQWNLRGQHERDTIGLSLWLVFMTIIAGGLCWFTA